MVAAEMVEGNVPGDLKKMAPSPLDLVHGHFCLWPLAQIEMLLPGIAQQLRHRWAVSRKRVCCKFGCHALQKFVARYKPVRQRRFDVQTKSHLQIACVENMCRGHVWERQGGSAYAFDS